MVEYSEEDLTQLVRLFLRMMRIGFDELPMAERVEFVQLSGMMVGGMVNSFFRKLSVLEKRVESLENKKMGVEY